MPKGSIVVSQRRKEARQLNPSTTGKGGPYEKKRRELRIIVQEAGTAN